MRFLALATAALIAAPVAAQTMDARNYVKNAGASDLYERQSSQLVLQTTRNPAVRRFAQMMIRHHTKSTADVKAAAMRAHLRPAPPMLMPDQRRMVAELRSARGRDRDATYITQQKMAHQQALQLHQSYSNGGDARPLRAAATKIVPVVQSHIDMLSRM